MSYKRISLLTLAIVPICYFLYAISTNLVLLYGFYDSNDKINLMAHTNVISNEKIRCNSNKKLKKIEYGHAFINIPFESSKQSKIEKDNIQYHIIDFSSKARALHYKTELSFGSTLENHTLNEYFSNSDSELYNQLKNMNQTKFFRYIISLAPSDLSLFDDFYDLSIKIFLLYTKQRFLPDNLLKIKSITSLGKLDGFQFEGKSDEKPLIYVFLYTGDSKSIYVFKFFGIEPDIVSCMI